MLIEIHSDVVCPWCWIGKRRLEQALERFVDADQVKLSFRPFQLDPTAPREAAPVIETYAAKFGGVERAREIMDRVTAVAAEVGLGYRMDIAQRANTFDAHRVLWFAAAVGDDTGDAGLQPAVKERLLQAYFSEGRDIGDHEVLVSCAADAGLDGDAVRRMLDSDEGSEQVTAELEAARRAGITAVPTFVFHPDRADAADGPNAEGFVLSGAQEPDLLLRVLERLGA